MGCVAAPPVPAGEGSGNRLPSFAPHPAVVLSKNRTPVLIIPPGARMSTCAMWSPRQGRRKTICIARPNLLQCHSKQKASRFARSPTRRQDRSSVVHRATQANTSHNAASATRQGRSCLSTRLAGDGASRLPFPTPAVVVDPVRFGKTLHLNGTCRRRLWAACGCAACWWR